MTGTFKTGIVVALITMGLCAAAFGLVIAERVDSIPVVIQEKHSPEFQAAFFEAARVYGRAGCGDQALAETTARHALSTGLSPALVAAMVASESNCNPLAVSSRGAVGLTQIMPKLWSKQFDFSSINLFNPEDNLTVSTTILSKLIRDHGVKLGLARYYGTGADDIGLGGAGYATRVLNLAGKL